MKEYNISCFSKTEERKRDTKRTYRDGDKERQRETKRDIKRQIQKVHIAKLHIEHPNKSTV